MAASVSAFACRCLLHLTLLLVVVVVVPYSTIRAQSMGSPSWGSGWSNNCDFCLASQGISPLEVGSSGLRVDVRYLRVGTPYLDGTKIDNKDQELETHLTQQYSLFYAMSSRFTVAGFLPLSKRHSEQLSDDGTMVTGNQFGVGDVSLILRYKALVEHAMESTTILSFTAGVKLPTGRTDGTDSEGNLLDAHIQLGTGSTDFLTGVSGFFARDRTALILNLLGGFTTKGANGHQFGNNLNYDLTARYRVYPADYEETQFFATLGVNGEWRGKEIQDGIADDFSGGSVTYVTPGIQIFFSPVISFEASFQYPIVHGLHGQQLGEDYRITTGLQVLLH